MRRNATVIATDWAHRDRTSPTESPPRGTVERPGTPALPDRSHSPGDAAANSAPLHRPIGLMTEREESDRSGQNGRTGRLLAQIDLTKVLVIGELAAAGTVIAIHLFDHLDGLRGGPRARIQMGPGGWVSMRGGAVDIRTRRARTSMGSRPARRRRSACQDTSSQAARGLPHDRRTSDHQPCGYRGGRQLVTDRAGSGRRPWWAVLLGAKSVETH
ncbi:MULTISPECIES: hypothetical protein [unclassified Pseudofrankia]|uniref:hypothetical protein n=1 Tax=unclassified Pseudofrankia TaxID=2994372 RepID=UPI0008D90868|nr:MULTISPECIES: hypothetical protein [unclassified Pseudofrankia]MDT3445463.1 hypothetical protein [Pseudofrankia sp. BMG5.37]OHV67503.1 hypothetical protein BCD48_35265 [Pseudofrankia sp. BMG5.36]